MLDADNLNVFSQSQVRVCWMLTTLTEGVSCRWVPPRHALCVKTQGHRDAQGNPGTPRDAALEML